MREFPAARRTRSAGVGPLSCPQEPIPKGWKVWRSAEVPTPLVQTAIDIRDHVRQYQRGTIAKTMVYNGQTVAFWVSSHTWTYRNGVLVTGLCIAGVSILVAVPAGTQGIGGTQNDSLDTPDPTAAVYDGAPPESTNWALVAISAGAGAAVVAAFWLALHFAGRKRLTA